MAFAVHPVARRGDHPLRGVGAIIGVDTNGWYAVVECTPAWPHSVSMTRLTALSAALDAL